MTRLRADALLLLTAAIWGTAFVAQKAANATMGPIAFVGARFLIAALMLLPLVFYEAKKASAPLTVRDFAIAAMIGLCLLAASILQQIALVTTTATNAGFLTALYVVLVPITTWLLTRERVRPFVIVACVMSVSGAWLLTANGPFKTWTAGDAMLVASDVIWAFWITLIAIFQKRAERPFFLSFAQFGITAILALGGGFIFEGAAQSDLEAALPAILYTGIISGGLAFTLQILAQRHTPPAEAAVIMSLESVFAAIAGAIWLAERLTPLAMAGCGLIFCGVIVAEAGPALWRSR